MTLLIITYYYCKATNTTHPDGLQIFEFHSNNQIEYHYPDGRREIVHPNKSKHVVDDKNEFVETFLPNGTRVKECF